MVLWLSLSALSIGNQFYDGASKCSHILFHKDNAEILPWYRISFVIKQSFFYSKQSQKSSSILKDVSRYLELFRKGKTCIVANFRGLILYSYFSHFREGKTPSYSAKQKLQQTF